MDQNILDLHYIVKTMHGLVSVMTVGHVILLDYFVNNLVTLELWVSLKLEANI